VRYFADLACLWEGLSIGLILVGAVASMAAKPDVDDPGTGLNTEFLLLSVTVHVSYCILWSRYASGNCIDAAETRDQEAGFWSPGVLSLILLKLTVSL